jgi:hypothetical protein
MLRSLDLEIAKFEVETKASNMRGEVLVKLVVDSFPFRSSVWLDSTAWMYA